MRQLAAVFCPSMLALQLVAAPNEVAFREVAVGQPVRNRTMPTVDGRKEPLLGKAKANVFVFFRTGQDHSVEALKEIADLERELAGKSVRFVGVVSSTDAAPDVLAVVRETGVRMPVLVDEGDALYGELGVYLHPSVGIADDRQRLAAYQPFRKINLRDVLRGRIQLVLGEISEAQLAAIVDPPRAGTSSDDGRAKARVKLARALLSAGSVDAAIESLRAGIALEPDLAEAHALLAEALARKGACPEAEAERATVRRLAPADPVATAPLACRR